MAKTRKEMIARLEEIIQELREARRHYDDRAIEFNIDPKKHMHTDGILVHERLLGEEISALLAIALLRDEDDEEEEPKEPLFDELMHIYWSANNTSFCLSPPGNHGILRTRGYEVGRPDCPECHEKLVQFRSM